jgi:hypothetical protein
MSSEHGSRVPPTPHPLPLTRQPPPSPSNQNTPHSLRLPRSQRSSRSSSRSLGQRCRCRRIVGARARRPALCPRAPVGHEEAGRLDAQQGRLALQKARGQAAGRRPGVPGAGDRQAARRAVSRGAQRRRGECGVVLVAARPLSSSSSSSPPPPILTPPSPRATPKQTPKTGLRLYALQPHRRMGPLRPQPRAGARGRAPPS